MANKKEFKTESKQLLNLMIHSIYSTKDIFLRELISNASDALDKRQFYAIQDADYKYQELNINLSFDKAKKIITIEDTGLGMDEEDLENNLGTIAKSGSKEFIEKLKETNDQGKAEVIGQFGVGFYSSFIVADKVEVDTKKPNSDALLWVSDGIESYEIKKSQKKDIGTKITLHLKNDKEILEFLDQNKLQDIVKMYSDYVKYPIYMDVEEIKYEEDPNDKEKTVEKKEIVNKILNSQIALWQKEKKNIKKEEYDEFYKNKYYDFQDPIHIIHSKAEGTLNYSLLLFIPKEAPFDYNTPNVKKGLDLYSKGILIDHSVDYLLPTAFGFVRGLIDSQDLNLNISREMLQKDIVVNKLVKNIEKKIQKELLNIQKKKREEYNDIFTNFGRTIIYGLYENYGKDKELLKDLVMFKSTKDREYVTLKEYVERNKDQEEIYYVSGESIEKINQMPTMEKILEKDIEVLYFLNDVDEFAIQVLGEYGNKKFKSITGANLNLDTKEEKEEVEKITKENKDILENIHNVLKDKVDDVKLTTKLSSSAVSLSSGEGISLEMEKVLAQMPGNENARAKKILEINPNHDIFKILQNAKENDLENYSKLLYSQALLTEGMSLEDPQEYAKLIDKLIIKSGN